MSKREYSGAMDLETYLGIQKAKSDAELNRFGLKVQSNKTLPDYLARMAVGAGNAGAYVVEAPFKVGAFLGRGAYKLIEGASKLAVGLAPHLVNAYVAKLQYDLQTRTANTKYAGSSGQNYRPTSTENAAEGSPTSSQESSGDSSSSDFPDPSRPGLRSTKRYGNSQSR